MKYSKRNKLTARFNVPAIIGLLSVILLVGCTGSDVITVGSTHISRKDLEYRQKISELYYPQNDNNRLAAAVQLLNGALGMEILKTHGLKIDNADLEAEAKRIDDTTKAPEKLQKIKDVFGADRGAYLKNFVAIVYAERSLYNDIYLKRDEIHKAQMAKAVEFLKSAEKNASKFKESADKSDLKYVKLKISAKNGITFLDPENKHPRPPEDPEGAKKMIESLKGTNRGEISKNILDWPFAYQAIRLLDKKGDDYYVESAIVTKMPFMDWFWEHADKVPVTINDKALKDEMNAKVDWMKKVKQQ